MKRKKVFLSAAALMTLLIGMSISAAASTNTAEEKYCGVCGAALVSYGTNIGHYSNSHDFYYVNADKERVDETCDVAHIIDKVDKYCPTHGFRWSGNRHTELHSKKNCPYYNMIPYYD